MESLFAAVEQWPLSVWAREDTYAYFVALIFHAWGTAVLAGGGVFVALRGLGVGGATALMGVRGFVSVLWGGAVLALMSGLLLLVGYPAKALTNPLFGLKLACLLLAALTVRRLLREGQRPSLRLAGLSIVLWCAVVVAGKLLLHTYTVLTVS